MLNLACERQDGIVGLVCETRREGFVPKTFGTLSGTGSALPAQNTHNRAYCVALAQCGGRGGHEAVHAKTKNLGFQNHSSLFIQAQERNFIAALKFPPQKHEIAHDKREAAPVTTFQQ
jgi:hypothetical protein